MVFNGIYHSDGYQQSQKQDISSHKSPEVKKTNFSIDH